MAVTADHLVISEIQTAGTTSNDEFIELYNPTEFPVDISEWSIQYRGGLATSYYKKNFTLGSSVPAYGFFLIARNGYDGAITADLSHASFFLSSKGGTVFLVNNQTLLAEETDNGLTVIDKVAYGTTTTNSLRPEGVEFSTAPKAHQSIERKTQATSTSDSMSTGGEDALFGNGEDSNNNSGDFISRDASEPQNTQSPTEQLPPTPTPTTTSTPTPTPTPTPAPTFSSSSPDSNSDPLQQPSSACTDAKPGSAPILLSATVTDPNEIILNWSKASGPVTYYLIAFGTSSGAPQYGNPNIGGQETTSYKVSGLSSGTTYYFRVRAGNNCMPGDYSNEIAVTPSGQTLPLNIPPSFQEGVLGEKTEAEVPGPNPEISPSAQILGGGTVGSFFDEKRNPAFIFSGLIILGVGYFFLKKFL